MPFIIELYNLGGTDRGARSSETFADVGYVVWIAAEKGAGRKAGRCSYEGRSLDHIVKDAHVTLRSLEDGAVVAEETLKGRASGCPSTVYGVQSDTVFVSRPRPADTLRWVLKNLPCGG